MSNVLWTLYSHPENGDLKVIVGYHSLGGRNNSVVAIIPLYDLRDTDHSGSVSWGETLLPWVPFVGGAVTPMQEAELMIRIGMDLKDADLVRQAQLKALGTAFKTADKAFRKQTLAGLVKLPLKQALAAFPLDTIANYVVKKASSEIVNRLLGI
jgi:hypothetical protein